MFPKTLCRILILAIIPSLTTPFYGNRINKFCEPNKFYKPYVRIFWQRRTTFLFRLYSPGFADLRNQHGVYMCVNGPAILYTGIEEKPRDLAVFKTETQIKIYAHECFAINRPPKALSWTPPLQSTGAHDMAALHFHPEIIYPTDLLNKTGVVHGIRAYGITLLGAVGDYTKPSLFLFPEKNFGNNDKQIFRGSSIITIGNNEWKMYDKMLKKNITVKPEAEGICSNAENALLDAHIRKSNLWQYPSGLLPWRSRVGRDVGSNEIEISVGGCEPIPVVEDVCKSKMSPSKDGCDTMISVLELNDNIVELEWKRDIIILFRSIFNKICPQINENAIESATFVFLDKYIMQQHKKDGSIPRNKDSDWDNLIDELEHCRDESSGMEMKEFSFKWDDGTGAPLAYKKPNVYRSFGEFEEQNPSYQNQRRSNDFRANRRRPLLITRHDGRRMPIYHYIEAADEDYEFNLAIDIVWKMFSTVMGYCNRFYPDKRIVVFSKLFDRIQNDFLEFNRKEWIDPSMNDIYYFTMGDGEEWLDECMEGSYIHSNTEGLRPIRQLRVGGGSFFNRFTKVPPVYK